MSNDVFKRVNYTAGQEVRSQDLVDSPAFLESRLMDQVLGQLIPGPVDGFGDPEDLSQHPSSGFVVEKWAYCLTAPGGRPKAHPSDNTKIRISGGTLFQRVPGSAADGDEPVLLPYTFQGTDDITIAAGDATNPRVDVIQMKLEWETADSQSRVIESEPVTASMDLGTLTTNDDTVIEAVVSGDSGNNITVIFGPSGGGVVYSEAGNIITILYEDGVSTVGNVEASITANSTLIEIKVSGTLATVLHDPADSFASTHLAGGVDSLLSSGPVDMKRRVKCTLSVVTGIAATPPVYPDPNIAGGYVPLAAIVVPATWTGVGPVNYYDDNDTANRLALHDQRMPIKVGVYGVYASKGIYDPSIWVPQNNGRSIKCNSDSSIDANLLIVPCPATKGRIIAIAIDSKNSGSNAGIVANNNIAAVLEGLREIGTGNRVQSDLTTKLETTGTAKYHLASLETLELLTQVGPLSVPNTHYGPPVWANGGRAPEGQFAEAHDHYLEYHETIALFLAKVDFEVSVVTFFVAEGL
jgi:hypothetical protein